MNHSAARSAVDDLFLGRGRKLSQLRSHLEGCVDCRAYYDRAAGAFRALTGKPEEMTPEELQLFTPVFLTQAESPMRRFAPWLGAMAAAAAVLVAGVVAGRSGPEEFTARGGVRGNEHPAVRALCSRQEGSKVVIAGDPAQGACAAGDRLAFIALGHGRPYVAVALLDGEKVEWMVSGPQGALTTSQEEVVLPNASTWRPGLHAVALYGASPIDPATAEPCAKGACPGTLERTEIPLSSRAP